MTLAMLHLMSILGIYTHNPISLEVFKWLFQFDLKQSFSPATLFILPLMTEWPKISQKFYPEGSG